MGRNDGCLHHDPWKWFSLDLDYSGLTGPERSNNGREDDKIKILVEFVSTELPMFETWRYLDNCK